MKIKTFELDTNQITTNITNQEQIFKINVLPAYAIDYAILYLNGQGNPIDNTSIIITNDKIVWKIDPAIGNTIDHSDTCWLEIRYYGIREYNLLFPKILVSEPDRAHRLGLYYEEMEKCFDDGAWLSFMLMAGAIFEHLLYFTTQMSKNALYDLSIEAKSRSIITNSEFDIIDKTRKYRNAVHCNKLSEPYVERKDAMDARSLIEKLILKI